MSWLFIVIVAHFFYAAVFIADRYLLKRRFPNPLGYTFYAGIFSIIVLLLAIFDFAVPTINQIALALITGIVWLVASFAFNTALFRGESSRVVPTVGALIPFFTLILSFMFLGERLSAKELIAFCLLVSGGIILSLLITKTGIFSNNHEFHLAKAFILAIGAALAFAIYFVMTKSVFFKMSFINGIIWIRLGAFLGALFLLIPAGFRRIIFKKKESIKKTTVGLYLSTRGMGIVASFLLFWAISLGSVTLVNALQGVQYLFLLLLAYFLFKNIPALKEQFSKEALVQKIIAITLICAGLAILVL